VLVLFDVDGTLLMTSGVGRAAMARAGEEIFGDRFTLDGVNFAGNLDPLIWRAAAMRSGIEDTPDHLDSFRARYGEYLDARLLQDGAIWALPGARELVSALRTTTDLTLGVLTGNWPETGRRKLEAAGFDTAHFPVRVWGDDGPVRSALPPVAMERCALLQGRTPRPQEVLIIGDTPNDIDCARAHGCRVLAVATGPGHSASELAVHRPDHLVADLTDTTALVRWILTGGF